MREFLYLVPVLAHVTEQVPVVLDVSDDSSASTAVVSAIADAEGISPMDVRPPLASVIDPDALDRLVASMTGWTDEPSGVVEFMYNGYIVSVTGNGDISVSEIDASKLPLTK